MKRLSTLVLGLTWLSQTQSPHAACPPTVPLTCPVLSITPYGATGDDASIDTVAVQNALDCAKVCVTTQAYGGSAVVVPPGRYYVGGLKVPSNVTLRGEGPGVSVLELPSGTATNVDLLRNELFGSGSYDAYITVTDLTLDGNKPNQTNGQAQFGVHFVKATDFVVRNCEIRNFEGHGMVLQNGAARGLIDQCTSHDNGEPDGLSMGFYAQTHPGQDLVHSLKYSGCEARGNTHNGYGLYNAENILYEGCTAIGNSSEALSSGFAADSDRHVTYVGCVARENNYLGFGTWTCNAAPPDCPGPAPGPGANLRYVGCVATGNGYNGFGATEGRETAWQGCVARDNGRNGASDTTRAGVLIGADQAMAEGQTATFAFSGGIVSGNQGPGIMVDGKGGMTPTTNYGTIADSIIVDNSQYGNGVYDGILLNNAQRVLVTGCTITSATATKQNYAIQATGVNSDFLYAFTNYVGGNLQSITPIALSGANSQADHNPQ